MDDDFDSTKFDQKMEEVFNNDFYNDEDTEKPVFEDDDFDYSKTSFIAFFLHFFFFLWIVWNLYPLKLIFVFKQIRVVLDSSILTVSPSSATSRYRSYNT